MGTVQELTDFLNAHQLIDFKMPAIKSLNEASIPDGNSPNQKSGLDASFSTMTEIYGTCIHSNFPGETTNDITTKSNKESVKSEYFEGVRRTAKEKILEFSQSSSMHGLSQAMGNRPMWRRLIWAVLVIGFAAWATYNAFQIISDFQGHPVMTSVSSKYQGKVKFPAVTICNLNRIRRSAVPDIVERMTDFYFAQAADVNFINLMISLYMRSFSKEDLFHMGHQLERMLFKCRFGMEYCWVDNFTHSHNLRYGNCYTFASSHFLHRDEWSSQAAGPAYGLTLELDVEYDEYIPTSPVSGVKVLIHDNGEVPFPEDGGLVAGTGHYTSVGVRKTLVKRLAYPYGDCIDDVDMNNLNKNLYSEVGFKYSLNACLKSCFQENVYRHCNCCDPSVPCPSEALHLSTSENDPDGKIPLCNITKSQTAECVNRVGKEFAENVFGCAQSCPPPCTESSFATSVSTAKWPAYYYWGTLLASRNFRGNINDYIKKSANTFLKVDVYFDNLILQTVESQPAYSWNKLLGDIGGQLGLMLGFSILTAVEIVELLVIDLGFALGVRALWRRQNRTKQTPVEVKQAWDSSV